MSKIKLYMCEGVEFDLEEVDDIILLNILIMEDYKIMETIIKDDVDPSELRVAVGEEISRRNRV